MKMFKKKCCIKMKYVFTNTVFTTENMLSSLFLLFGDLPIENRILNLNAI